ncbi:MAG: helix-turn-helix domain-containing protein [Eubacteriales bacterium]
MYDIIAANAECSEIEVLNQSWAGGTSYSYKMKKRPFWGLCFITDGSIVYRTKNSKTVAESGDIVILKKGSLYSAEFMKHRTNDILINFHCSASSNIDRIGDITLIKDRKDLKNDFLEILNYAVFKERGYMVKSVLYRILDSLTQSGLETALSAKIKQIINSDPSASEADIAKAFSVSVSTLQRTFKYAYGKTVSKYKNDIRMEKAKKLLLSGMYSVEETAVILNFCDSAYFSRCFKKYTGLSPKKFVKQAYII